MYANELNNLNNILLDILNHIDITFKNINQVMQIFNMIQKQGYSDFLFTKAVIVINNERIVFGDYIQKTYSKVGYTNTLINDAIDESENMIAIVSKKKAPTYVNKENKKIYT